MTYRGHIKNGQIQLDDAATLPEGAQVQVQLIESDNTQPAIWNKLLELAGTVKCLPSDAAKNHDQYLYGDSKQS
jgi:hypothetical protein